MFNRLFLAGAIFSLALAGSSQAHCCDDLGPSGTAESLTIQPRASVNRPAEHLLDEIVNWLSSNFDLPAAKDRPAVAFASKTRLAIMRAEDRVASQGFAHDVDLGESSQRHVVALYDNKSRTIYLTDDWIGKSPADQSVLVHELVHHLQNVAESTFECPQAREKMAYMAQDKWLGRFGTSLEKEFEVDMFTVLISAACMN